MKRNKNMRSFRLFPLNRLVTVRFSWFSFFSLIQKIFWNVLPFIVWKISTISVESLSISACDFLLYSWKRTVNLALVIWPQNIFYQIIGGLFDIILYIRFILQKKLIVWLILPLSVQVPSWSTFIAFIWQFWFGLLHFPLFFRKVGFHFQLISVFLLACLNF